MPRQCTPRASAKRKPLAKPKPLSKPKRLALEQWADGKSLLLSMFAQSVALSAEECFEALKLARSWKNIDGSRQLPPFDQWRSFYDNHIEVMDMIIGCAVESMQTKETQRKFVRVVRGAATPIKTQENFQRYMKQSVDWLIAHYRQHIESIRADLEMGIILPPNLEKVIRDPRTLFFFRVTLPAWLEFGKTPQEMLYCATNGSHADVFNLLRLDPYMKNDPIVINLYDHAIASGNKNLVKRLNTACSASPQRPLKIRKLKVTLAALIYKVFADWDEKVIPTSLPILRECGIDIKSKIPKQKLGCAEIRRLFNAIQKDRDPEERYSDYAIPSFDPDLPETDRALWAGIKRDLEFWPDGDGLTNMFGVTDFFSEL